MSGHTPGPWTWVEDTIYGGYSGIVGPNGEEVLSANSANDGDEGHAWFEDFPSEADRALITAAPLMYEALTNCVHEMEDQVRAGLTPGTALALIQRAIARAEGRP